MTAPLIIIGSGLAGYNLAKEWRKLEPNAPLMILTEEAGYFYSKPLLSTAVRQNKMRDTLPIADCAAMAAQLQADIRPHTAVTAIHPHDKTLVTNHGPLSYQSLVLAVGASPVSPNWPGKEHTLSVNLWEDYWQLRARLTAGMHLVIIGSGLVGSEFANDLLALNIRITVLSIEGRILERLMPPAISEAAANSFQEAGIAFSFHTKVTAIEAQGKGYVVHSDQGDFSCDLVVSACGLKANTGLAATAGLKYGDGIIVDRQLATSDPHIFALGDCATIEGLSLHYVSPLMQCARALAPTLCGTPTPVHFPVLPVSVKTPLYPMVVYTHPKYPPHSWEVVQQEGLHFYMRAHDENHTPVGFALTGPFLKERLNAQAGLPELLAART